MRIARSSNDRLRHLGSDMDNRKNKKDVKNKLRKTHYRIGEASNPGPDGNLGKQSKIGDSFIINILKR
eukprot:16437074-Heterocapsa_arctica.AAC.1